MEARLRFAAALLLLVQLVSVAETREVPSSEAERLALLNLRTSLGISARYWHRKTHPCHNWTGVECQDGRVVGLNLSGLRRSRTARLNPRLAVDDLANLTLLASFNSSGFSLPGTIPDWFGPRLGALQVLDLRSCLIDGTVPPSLGSLNRLKSLFLSDNSITGSIPGTLGQLSSLSVLDLSHNLLTGSIPIELFALSNLTTLNLWNNYLQTIPSGLSSVSGIQFLNLRNNSLTGQIPAQVGELSRLVELDLANNVMSGTVPANLGQLRSLKRMMIQNNHLQNSLPGSLWSLPLLQLLDVSGNNLTGKFSNFSPGFNISVAVFNFANNLFYGNLTPAFGRFGRIDLSGNYFQGLPPTDAGYNIVISRNCFNNESKQREHNDCTRFYAEKGSLPPEIVAPPPSPQQTKSSRRLIYIVVGVFGGFALFVLLLLILYWKIFGKGNGNHRESADRGAVPEGGQASPKLPVNLAGIGDLFEYEKVVQAANGFSDSNLIKHGHSGDLFLGTLESGSAVVIKRVDLRSVNNESYILELDALRKVKHPRLVPFLGHSMGNEHEKFLVYKYMHNRDLSTSLYRFTDLEDSGLQSLDWITRLKIAIGAAEFLSYLHHDCDPPLVHRDIQASSILLDDKYEVRLGSLSEVCAQEGDNHQNGITRLLWNPETSESGIAGSTRTCSYDVYCFGRVLLELVTGKLGISNPANASTVDFLEQTLPFIGIHKKEQLTKIIDPSLVIDEDLLEEVWAMAIVAKSCLNLRPSRRPLMRHVLRALENPFKVVRDESFCSKSRLRTTSSTRSWNAAFFGSWRLGSSEHAGQINRDSNSSRKQSDPHDSGTNTKSSTSFKRSSSDIFPEQDETQDVETQNGR